MSHGAILLWLGELIIVTAIAFYVYKSGLRAIGWINLLQGVMMFCRSILVGLFVIYTALVNFSISKAFHTLQQVSPQHLTLPGATDNFPPIYWTTSILISIFSFWLQFWVWAVGAKDKDTARRQYLYVPIFYFVTVLMLLLRKI